VGFSIEEYARLRPVLWHFTHKYNLPLIRRRQAMLSAAQLVPGAVTDEPRRGRSIREGVPVLRDQDLLHEGSVALQAGWTMADLVRDLNRRVFFWSGWPDRPVKSGRRPLARYTATDLILRIPFRDVVAYGPQFSRCNSGATRKQQGIAVPRGPNTFVAAEQSPFTPRSVVEVSFLGKVSLPKSTQVGQSIEGPWEAL